MQVAAIALGVRDRPKEELRETVIEFLRQRQTLLVLDNCEHMIPAAAAFSRLVLDNCPGVRVLATSREPTKVGGEKTLAVPSMALPDQHGSPSVDQMRRFAAVALFVERAASAGSFALNSDNSNDVIRVCRDLDGIPLAIELAARRTLALSVRQIAERLDDRFRLLKGGSDASLPRHRTLLAAMDWSYDLLTPEEQTVLRQSSLFAGTFDLEAVEAMCANGSLPVDAVDAMTELVAKSLVEANTAAPEARYRLLDTIRKYAYRRLDEAGELGEVRERYIDYYAALARELETIEYGLASGPHPSSPDQSFKRAGIELANVRAAVAYCGDSQRAVEAVEIATNFGKYWVHKGPLSEGELWLRESLRISSDIPTELEAEAILVMAQLALAKGDVDRSEKLHERSLSLFRELGDIGNIAVLLHDLGQVALFKGDPDRARRLSEEGLDLRRELGDSGPVAHALVGLSEVERYSGAYERARQLLNEALHLMEGQHDWLETTARAHLGMVALDEGDFDAGEHLIAESMATWRDRESRIDLAENLVCMAGVRAEQQDFPASAALLGAVAAELDATSAVLWPPIPRTREHYESVCRAELGNDAFQAAFNRGLALTVDEAIDFALKGTAQPDSQA
jgi:non-specific serine/threonine protein kinase